MSLGDLLDAEIAVIDECLRAAADGPFFPEWEFHTLFGLHRAEVTDIAAAWPDVDVSDDDVEVAISNTLVHLLGYPHCRDDVWSDYISLSREELERLFTKWCGDDVYIVVDKPDFRVSKWDRDCGSSEASVTDVLKSVLEELPQSTAGRDAFSSFLGLLTQGQRGLLVTSVYQERVNTGGILAFFRSHAGDFGPATLSALFSIGAHDHQRLLRRAMTIFGPRFYPTDFNRRNEELNRLAKAMEVIRLLSETDDAFDALQRTDSSLAARWQKYVDEHPDDFFR